MSGFLSALFDNIQENQLYAQSFLFGGALILWVIAAKGVLPSIHYVIRKSPTKWDDMLARRRVLEKLVWFPSLLFMNGFSFLMEDYQRLLQKFILLMITWTFMRALDRFLLAVNDIYETLSYAKGNSIKGFVQVLEILVFLFGGIIMVSIIMGKSPWMLLSGIGAMTAVLLLIFKDTILSLVASVRISSNKLIEKGDWIEMPQFGADGDVIDIALHSIQVQNWDKTITSIPTHKLIDESFKNWKGMTQAGGRRIMRSIHLDLDSVAFCDQAMLDRFEKIEFLKDYLGRVRVEVAEHNRQQGIDETDFLNGLHLTNLGTFRAYVNCYLKQHPGINHQMTTMTRQLQPEATGLPLQIYAFTNTTDWVPYEGIQADIMDHLLAILPVFGLRVFQYPSGGNLRALTGSAG